MNKNAVFLSAMVLLSSAIHAQENAEPVEMAELFYKEGKVWLVVLIVALVFAGMALYLFLLDRKITRLEKKIDEKIQ